MVAKRLTKKNRNGTQKSCALASWITWYEVRYDDICACVVFPK
jgi:hypothetical protein